MKYVVNTSQVAHLWANQQQDSARNPGGNLYFKDLTIYSYGSHFPMAKHVTNAAGREVVLFTERTYSNTTAKQIGVVRMAARHLDIIYCHNPENTHEQNFAVWLNKVENIAAKLLTAKKPEIYLSQIDQVKEKVSRYADFFSLDIPNKLGIALNIGNKGEYLVYQDVKEALDKAARLKAEKELKARHKKELSKWLKGENSRLYVHDGYDYLRIKDERIETTQAVQVPVLIAKRLWQKIKDNTITTDDRIMDYAVASVGKEIKIGCHNFKTDYLLKFGEQIFTN